MKKTYTQLTDDLQQVIVEADDGHTLTFLNGVMKMPTNEKFIVARGPVTGALMLIISDYGHWVQNEKIIQEWIDQFSGGIRREGMTLTFDHDADRTAFLLRWA